VGTFSSARIEYEDPPVPQEFDRGRNLRRAYLRGFTCGIWHDRPVYKRYRSTSSQAAFAAGYEEAQLRRRAKGETL
jgi:hypothetical protein